MPLDPTIPLRATNNFDAPGIQRAAQDTYKLGIAAKQAGVEQQLNQLKVVSAKNDVMVKLLGGATDQASYDNAKQQATTYGIDVSKAPETYDPAFVKQITMASLDAKDRLDNQFKQLQLGETMRHNAVDEHNTAARTDAMYNSGIPGLGGIGNGVMTSAPAAAAPMSGPAGVANPTLPTGMALQPPAISGTGGVAPSPTSALLPPPKLGAPNPSASPTTHLTPAPSSAPSPSTSPTTPGALPQGAEYLNLLKQQNPALGSMVEAIGNGQQPMPPATTRGGRPNPLALAVNQAFPGMSASDWQTKNATQKDYFGGGKSAQAINALNTAMQHAGELSDKVEQMNNGKYPVLNAIENKANTAFGGSSVSNFNTVIGPLAQEITSAYRGSGGAEADIQNQMATIGNPNASKKQQHDALKEIVTLMAGRVNSLKDQYDSVMNGTGRPLTVIRPETQKQMDKITQRSGGNAPTATTVAHGDIDAELAKRGVK